VTGLVRTDLPTSRKVDLAALALSRRSEHGATTELAREFEVSRPTAYVVR
jgi:hypothetical protein